MKKFLTLLIVILLNMSVAHAEIKTYEGFSEFFVKDESIETAKQEVEGRAMRDILEQICIYVKSHSEATNSQLNDDEIIVISAGILRVTNTKFFIDEYNGGLLVKSFVMAEIDTDELETLLEREVKARLGER